MNNSRAKKLRKLVNLEKGVFISRKSPIYNPDRPWVVYKNKLYSDGTYRGTRILDNHCGRFLYQILKRHYKNGDLH